MNCEHANEVPHICPCSSGCYCKSNTCAERKSPALFSAIEVLSDQLEAEKVLRDNLETRVRTLESDRQTWEATWTKLLADVTEQVRGLRCSIQQVASVVAHKGSKER